MADEILKQYKVDAVALPLDVTSPTAAESILAAAEERGGTVGIVVAAAGSSLRQTFAATPKAEADQLVLLNANALARLLHAVTPSMVAARRGRILAVGSIVGVSAQVDDGCTNAPFQP